MKIRTLIFEASGTGWVSISFNTIFKGIFKVSERATLPKIVHKNISSIFYKHLRGSYEALSYVRDWRDAFLKSKKLRITLCNINNLIEYKKCLKEIHQYDLIVILHSATGDSMYLLSKYAKWFENRKYKLAVFIGNEYGLMREKIKFLNLSKADYICSQLPLRSARSLYSQCSAEILAMPHALNPNLYFPHPGVVKAIDIGFIGALYPIYIGDTERNDMILAFYENAERFKLKCEFLFNNIPRKQWAEFLNKCTSIVGGESGTYYLDTEGKLISQAEKYCRKKPNATFKDVYDRFFKNSKIKYFSGKAISSRHFEPIGTKTCQILLEGYYNGILRPEEHYISVRKDLSNIDEAIEKFKDEGYRKNIVEQVYEYVIENHTYEHRVDELIKIISS
jgi:hypothetical protein